jgi:hypothetical protein
MYLWLDHRDECLAPPRFPFTHRWLLGVLMFKALAVALGLAQITSCANSVCRLLETGRFTEREIALGRTALDHVVDFAALQPDAMLVVTGAEYGPDHRERVIQRWDPRRGSQSLFRIRLRDVIGEGIALSAEPQWWYTVAGDYANRWGAVFVTGSAETVTAPVFVPLPVRGLNRWLPLKGATPSGLYVFEDGAATRAMEVTPAGTGQTWTFAHYAVVPGWWSAQRLPDGSIALASLDAVPGSSPARVVLRILRQGGDADETLLQRGTQESRISTAAGAGTLAVVVETSDNGIDAFIVDVGTPVRFHRLPLTNSDEKGRFPVAERNGDGFVVAWIDVAGKSKFISARSLKQTSAGLGSATIGPIAYASERRPFLGIAPEDKEIRFLWERGGAFVQRRVPSELAGFELFSELRDKVCATFAALPPSRTPSPR